MRNRFVWNIGLIILLLGISSLALGAKGCFSSKDTSDLVTGSSGTKQPFPLPDLIITPLYMNEVYFGRSITTGDFNGDGFDDLAVGSTMYAYGRVFVYYGSASGFSVSGFSAKPDWLGESSLSYGNALTIGDFNNDGFDDLAVGAEKYSNGAKEKGKVLVYHGSASGLSFSPNWIGESNQVKANYGASIAASDFNGDGFDDLAVGAPHWRPGNGDEGKAFVYHGSVSGLSATPNWTSELKEAGTWYGDSVSTGDFDNDGCDDLLVTTYCANCARDRIFIYHGSTTIGLSTTVKMTITGLGGSPGDINNDGFDDLVGGIRVNPSVSMLCVSYGSASGLSTPHSLPISYQECRLISPGGLYDFNNDGFRDLIIVGASATNGEGQEGKVWIHYGSASGFSTTFSWTGESNQVKANYGASIAAGDFNGDGLGDLAVGAKGYDAYNGKGKDRYRVGRIFIYYDVVGE